MSPRPDLRLAFLLGTLYVAVLLVTASSLGYARDEGFYFYAAHAYRDWFALLIDDPLRAIQRVEVDRYWSVNHEHPSLMKVLFAASNELFHEKLGWLAPGTSYRLPAMLLGGLAVALVHHWGARTYGRIVGLVSALAFGFMPRVFFHAHLACFDLPVAALWLLCAYTFTRSLETPGTWAWRTALCYGLLLDTKHNAWLFPAVLVLHTLLARVGDRLAECKRGRPYVPKAFISMALAAPVLLYVAWPWLWYDPLNRLIEYVHFHTRHEYYNMEFLGQTYWKPPMPGGYAWLMTLATVPATTLLLALLGLGVWLFTPDPAHAAAAPPPPAPAPTPAPLAKPMVIVPTLPGKPFLVAKGPEPVAKATTPVVPARVPTPSPPKPLLPPRVAPELLWLLAVLVSYAPWWSESTPIFGGTKHWITAYPFLALLAGRGFQLVATTLQSFADEHELHKRISLPAIGAACVSVVSVVMALRVHPYGLTAYTPLVGGAPGAATLGLNRTFWGYTTGSLSDFINERAPQGATIYLHDTAPQSFDMLRADGRLRDDLHGSLDIAGSNLALYHHEPHMSRVEYQIWVNYENIVPAAMLTHDGVPVTWIYERE